MLFTRQSMTSKQRCTYGHWLALLNGWHLFSLTACLYGPLHPHPHVGLLTLLITVWTDYRCGLGVTSLLLTQRIRVRSSVGSISCLGSFLEFYLNHKTNVRKFGPHLFTVIIYHGWANHDTEGKRSKSPIHCCDVTKPPYLFSCELCASPLHCKLCLCAPCAVGAPGSASCFSVLRTSNSDIILT